MRAQLILENGAVFEGRAFGHLKESIGEVVFNTSMGGYQEILTNPAYYGQIVVMTYPLIGNYGINLDDMESSKAQVRGLIVRERCDFPNNFRCELTLDGYMKANRIIGIEGIDTRALAKTIRDNGIMKGIIAVRELTPSQIKLKIEAFTNKDAVSNVTRKEITVIEGAGKHIGVLDLGVAKSLIKSLEAKGCKITIFPAQTSKAELLRANIDAVLISGGPGAPTDLKDEIETIKSLVGEKPLLGVGLGHELIALATGGEVSKLKFGHNGVNQPVKGVMINQVYTTTQSHNYVVSKLPQGAVATHINVNDETIEGIYIKEKMVCSIQFHPAAPTVRGDVDPIFDDFLTIVQGGTL